MRIGVVMWPTSPDLSVWREAEEMGFDHAWLFDHVAWRDLRPWYDAYTMLGAAAAVTSRIGIGTLVTTPNTRHPVTTAHAAASLSALSSSRFVLGVGAGGHRSDAGVLGAETLPLRERTDRFVEFVTLIDLLLGSSEPVSFEGRFWTTRDTTVGDRVPVAIAAAGPRGLRLAARHADLWITLDVSANAPSGYDAVVRQSAMLAEACAAEGRDPASLRRLIVVHTSGDSRPLTSVAAFRTCVARYADLGFTDLVVYWPHDGPFAADPTVFRAILA